MINGRKGDGFAPHRSTFLIITPPVRNHMIVVSHQIRRPGAPESMCGTGEKPYRFVRVYGNQNPEIFPSPTKRAGVHYAPRQSGYTRNDAFKLGCTIRVDFATEQVSFAYPGRTVGGADGRRSKRGRGRVSSLATVVCVERVSRCSDSSNHLGA